MERKLWLRCKEGVDAFDAIVLDIEMPRMNGWQLSKPFANCLRGNKSPS
jgi:CheY-like chemotaxis protein